VIGKFGFVALGAMLASAGAFAQQDAKVSRIDVDNYVIDAQINPETQTLTARAAVRFIRSTTNLPPRRSNSTTT
jgi:hypothetical protein